MSHSRNDLQKQIRKILKVFQKVISENGETSLWVFGYGSLMWNPGFEHSESQRAFLKGYSVRMWQGNTFHRGTKEMPGRCATIVPEASGETAGKAFKVVGISAIVNCLEHLYERELDNGYSFRLVSIATEFGDGFTQAVTVIAKDKNPFYLGPSESVGRMALEIATAEGKCGTNRDYLYRLVSHLQQFFPDFTDSHLFELKDRVVAYSNEE